MLAYVLIGLKEASERDVLDYFVDLDSVVEGNILFGEWDIILKLKMDSAEDVASFVIEKIRSHENVRLTSTLIVAK